MNYDMSSYFEDPEFKEALAKYEGMVENHTPAYFEADELIDIAEYYTLKGRHKDADKAIDLTLQLHPENTDALVFRIRSLMLQNKKEEAKVVAQLMEEDRIEEAEEIFKQLAMDEEYEVDTLLDIIQDYTNANQEEYAGQWVDCLFAHSDMQTLPKTNQRLRDVLCDYYSTFNKPDLAIPYLNMTLNEYPYSIEHWNELGKCHLQQCQYEEANEALDFALAIDDENTDSLTLKAFGILRLLSPSGQCEQEQDESLSGTGTNLSGDAGSCFGHQLYRKTDKPEIGPDRLRIGRVIF